MALGADTLARLRVELGLDTAQFSDGLIKSAKGATDFQKVLLGTGAIGATAFLGLAAGITAAAAAIVGIVKSTAEYADTIGNAADRTGLSTDAIQKWKFAAEQSGATLEDVTKSFGTLQKNLGEGTTDTVKAVQDLGLNFKTLRNESPDQQLNDVVKAVSNIENPTKRAAIGAQLLGKSFKELIPAGKDIDGLSDRAQKLGIVMSEAGIRAAKDFGDEMQALQDVLGGMARNIGEAVLQSEPLHMVMTGLADVFGEVSVWINKNQDAIRSWVDTGIVLAVKGVQLLIEGIGIVLPIIKVLADGFTYAQFAAKAMAFDLQLVYDLAAHPLSMGDTWKKASKQADAALADMNATLKSHDVILQNTEGFVGTLDARIGRFATSLEGATGHQHAMAEGTKKLIPPIDTLTKSAQAAAEAGEKLAAEFVKIQSQAGGELEKLTAVSVARRRAGDAYADYTEKLFDADNKQKESIIDIDQKMTDLRGTYAKAGMEVPDWLNQIWMTTRKMTGAVTDQQKEWLLNARDIAVVREHFEQLATAATTVAGIFDALGVKSLANVASGIGGVTSSIGAFKKMQEDAAAKGGSLSFLQNVGGYAAIAASMIGLAKNVFSAVQGIFTKPEWKKVMADIGETWGTEISEATAKSIADTEKKEKVSRAVAELLNIDKIIQDSGKSATDFAGQIVQLMQGTANGTIPLKEGMKEIDGLFGQLQEDGSASARALSTEMIKLARASGHVTKEMQAVVDAGIDMAIEGMGKFSSALDSSLLKDLDTSGYNAATIFVGTFNAAVKEKGFVGAAEAMADTFQKLKDNMGEWNQVGLDVLAPVRGIFDAIANEDLKPLIEGADGLRMIMEGLGQAGYLDIQTFDALGASSKLLFDKMIEGGMSTGDAIRVMAPDIQAAVRASEEFGYPLSADMQHLKDLAEQNGITFKTDPMDRMVEVLEAIAKALGADIPDAARKAGTALNNLPNTLPNQNTSNSGSYPGSDHYTPPPGGYGPPAGTRGYKNGTDGFEDFGSGTLVMLHGEEAVIPKSSAMDVAGSAVVSESSNTRPIVIQLDGTVLGSALIELNRTGRSR